MGIEKLVNIWQPCNGSKFRSNHTYNFWFDSVILVDQVWKVITFEIMICFMFYLLLCNFRIQVHVSWFTFKTLGIEWGQCKVFEIK